MKDLIVPVSAKNNQILEFFSMFWLLIFSTYSTNKTDSHDIIETLLKVVFNTYCGKTLELYLMHRL
jgi:hypothetical protein